MEPLISIIVPIYNVEQYLDKCVKSIVNQTYKNLEIILVDDGSPDKCPQMCDKWKTEDKRIKVIHKENGGLSDARNAGLEIMSGEYVAFVDSDDWLSIYYIEILYKELIQTDSDIVQCKYKSVDEKYCKEDKLEKYSTLSFNTQDALMSLIQEKELVQVVWNKLYKKELFGDLRFEFGKINEDDFFTYKIFSKCHKISYIDITLYYYLIREKSIMNQSYSLKRLDGVEARYLQYNFYKDNYRDIAKEYKKRFIFYILYCYQKSLFIENNDDLKKAKKVIIHYYKEIKKDEIKINKTFKEKIWIIFINISIELTARLRNLLKINI